MQCYSNLKVYDKCFSILCWKMDCQSTDIFEIYKLFSSLTENGISEMDNGFQVIYLNSYLLNL